MFVASLLFERPRRIDDPAPGICHPLYKRAFDLGSAMHAAIKAAGLESTTKPSCADDMEFKTHCATAKPADALNGLAYRDMDTMGNGFLVATLKRSLGLLHEAIDAHQMVVDAGLLPGHSDRFRDELFAIRQATLPSPMNIVSSAESAAHRQPEVNPARLGLTS